MKTFKLPNHKEVLISYLARKDKALAVSLILGNGRYKVNSKLKGNVEDWIRTVTVKRALGRVSVNQIDGAIESVIQRKCEVSKKLQIEKFENTKENYKNVINELRDEICILKIDQDEAKKEAKEWRKLCGLATVMLLMLVIIIALIWFLR